MPLNKVIIIGGGASGLMASISAAKSRAEVTVLEKMNRSGRKLSITGKGRCNITNTAPLPEFIERFGRNGRFLHNTFAIFFSKDLIGFLTNIGIKTETERGGRVFPVSDDADEVVEALIREAVKRGVKFHYKANVKRLLTKKNAVSGVETTNGKKYLADKVILTTGGASYPGTGSTGDGYKIAKSVGHSIVPIRPALIPLETYGNTASRLQGLSLKNVNVKVYIDNRKKEDTFGEMLFTHFGISGPIILTLSGLIVDALRGKKEVSISIDLKPALDENKLESRLLRDFKSQSNKMYKSMLEGLLPKKLITICIEQTGIPSEKRCNQISSDERKRLKKWLKDFRFRITNHRPLSEAIITAGGISIKEIDPKTMESKVIDGLYFAGEVIDINADTGGYNLQAAFSTGWVAGKLAGQR
ncbi:MAG: NAD(P)/FAD-dependent oxidoreductase [candidate division Zixibacteria bacterium]|nr:NAD(P)/FAD-dependent oxidoreductase [candidate division Zixibacteria bacterium]